MPTWQPEGHASRCSPEGAVSTVLFSYPRFHAQGRVGAFGAPASSPQRGGAPLRGAPTILPPGQTPLPGNSLPGAEGHASIQPIQKGRMAAVPPLWNRPTANALGLKLAGDPQVGLVDPGLGLI